MNRTLNSWGRLFTNCLLKSRVWSSGFFIRKISFDEVLSVTCACSSGQEQVVGAVVDPGAYHFA